MLDRGVYLPPSQFEAWFPSLAHTDAHVERTLEAAREALAEIAVSALAEVVAAADPALAAHAVSDPGPGRFDGALDGVRGFVLEAVYEGYLLHYGEPRAFAGMDATCALLAGDALYALGLARLAETGDLEAVAELSDLISRHGAGAGRRAGPPSARGAVGGERGVAAGRDRLPPRRAAGLVRSATKLALRFAERDTIR